MYVFWASMMHLCCDPLSHFIHQQCFHAAFSKLSQPEQAHPTKQKGDAKIYNQTIQNPDNHNYLLHKNCNCQPKQQSNPNLNPKHNCNSNRFNQFQIQSISKSKQSKSCRNSRNQQSNLLIHHQMSFVVFIVTPAVPHSRCAAIPARDFILQVLLLHSPAYDQNPDRLDHPCHGDRYDTDSNDQLGLAMDYRCECRTRLLRQRST
jgi:hypothetical protein